MTNEKYLKILKKQKMDLDSIKKETSEINNSLNINITNSETILKELGFSLPKKKSNSSIRIKQEFILRDWNEISQEAESLVKEASFNDLLTTAEIEKTYNKIKILRDEYDELNKANCDKFDYFIASGCGVVTGLIDAFFIGTPGEGNLGNIIDEKTNDFVKKIAKISGWNEEKSLEKGSNPLKSAISFLERKYKVNYDQQTGKAVDELFKISTKNHHLKSLAHSPSPIGLIFSIINQFNNTSTFVSEGKLITINTDKFELQGNNILSKLYCGFINWIMHIISDMAGSSGAKGRGSGIPIPFFELFQFLNIGKIGQHQKTIADISVLVFENGYDFRHGLTMSIPVILNELLVRLLWTLKLYFKEEKTLKEIIALNKSRRLNKVLFTAHGCFCLIDLADAMIKAPVISDPATKAVAILTRMNLIAWVRFSKLGWEEVKILLNKENEKNKYVDEKLNEEWKQLEHEVNLTYKEFFI